MKSMKRYHIYWNDKILLKDLEEEEFHNVWSKMHWVYNKELNFIEADIEKLPTNLNNKIKFIIY